MIPQHHLPADIERTSLSIITAELEALGLTPLPETAAVVKRVIHTTADFDYAKNLRFTPGAVAAGVAALRAGTPIITDTNMALSGISKPALARLGGSALCYMADTEVARTAAETGTTRAVASMHRAAQEHPGAILAVGNAPTALLTIVEEIEAGLRPALVIAVPVGFVNVVESKEALFAACAAHGVPAIAAMEAPWPPQSATPWSTPLPRCWTQRQEGGNRVEPVRTPLFTLLLDFLVETRYRLSV